MHCADTQLAKEQQYYLTVARTQLTG